VERRLRDESHPANSRHRRDDVTVDVSNWNVRFETDMKDASGKMVHVSADGKLDDLGSYHRTISGTWRQGTATGTFKLTRE
jgi:hypothetical protein